MVFTSNRENFDSLDEFFVILTKKTYFKTPCCFTKFDSGKITYILSSFGSLNDDFDFLSIDQILTPKMSISKFRPTNDVFRPYVVL